jgi:hypothetical protein
MDIKKRKRDPSESETQSPELQSHKIRHTESIDSRSLLDLEKLLDLSSLSDGLDISNRFGDIANALLCDFSLSLTCGEAATELEILELEFYLQKSGCHEDPFTHGSEEQKRSGRWFGRFCYSVMFVLF